MASSEVEICNTALAFIKAASINSLTEPKESARYCKLLYPKARRTVLSDHDWGFARKRQVLALRDETYSGWSYAYTFPIDCITARKIQIGEVGITYETDCQGTCNKTGKVVFEIIGTSDKNTKVLLTNMEDAELVYTADTKNPNMFDPMFEEALAYKLASQLAIPLKGKQSLMTTNYQIYTIVMSRAEATNANEEERPDENINRLRRSRL